MMKKTIKASLVALPLIFAATGAMANAESPTKGFNMPAFWLKGVELTDAQKTQLKTLREQNGAALKAAREANKAENQANRLQQGQLVFAENFDEAAARALATSTVEKRVAQRVAMMKSQHEVVKILTPEQKAQVQKNLENMAANVKKLKAMVSAK